jgi:hypothetical protein
MRKIAACLLVALGIDAAGYCVDQTRVPLVTSCFDVSADMSDFSPDITPDWHFEDPHFPKFCFGFCPEMEN